MSAHRRSNRRRPPAVLHEQGRGFRNRPAPSQMFWASVLAAGLIALAAFVLVWVALSMAGHP